MPSHLPVLSTKIAAPLFVVLLAGIAVLLFTWWPAGVVAGLVGGSAAVLLIAARLQPPMEGLPDVEPDEAERSEPATLESAPETGPQIIPSTDFELTAEQEEDEAPEPARDGVHLDGPDDLKARLGDAYPDFARAAHLVVSTQYASAARLQRDLAVPYSRARRLMDDLEEQHVVGPKTGSLPRQVLMPKDSLPEVDRLLAAV